MGKILEFKKRKFAEAPLVYECQECHESELFYLHSTGFVECIECGHLTSAYDYLAMCPDIDEAAHGFEIELEDEEEWPYHIHLTL